MLSTWDNNQYRANPYITEIWGGYAKITQEHFYFVGAKEKNRNAMTEALVTNYTVVKQTIKRKSSFEQVTANFCLKNRALMPLLRPSPYKL